MQPINVTVKYLDFEKQITLPEKFDQLKDKIIEVFNIPIDKESSLIIEYKNSNEDLIKINSQDIYDSLLLKIKIDEFQNFLVVSINENINNKILEYKEDNYDRDEPMKIQNPIFNKNSKEELDNKDDIMKILNESIEIKNNINNTNMIFDNNKDFKLNEDDLKLNQNNFIKSVMLAYSVTFPVKCNICQKFPVKTILYYCLKCNLFICEECENKIGYNHKHSYYKIKNKDQFNEIINMKTENQGMEVNNKNKTIIDKLVEKKNIVVNMIGSVFGFIKKAV